MRRLTAILLSLVTGIGGHYLNRRWDRAAFFLGLLYVEMIVAYFTLWGTFGSGPESEPSGFLIDMQTKWRYLFAGVGVILLLSAFVTWRDSRPGVRVDAPWHGPIPVVGAVLTTLMSVSMLGYVGLIGWIAVSAAGSTGFHEGTAEQIAPKGEDAEFSDDIMGDDRAGFPPMDEWIMQSLYLGGMPDYGTQLDPLPSGDAYLVGRLEFKGQPVVGAVVILTVNGTYTSARVTTDEQGLYTLRVPPGEWRINAVDLKKWPDKPQQGKYLLVSGLEPAADINRHPSQLYYDKGLAVTTSGESTLNPALLIRIREHLHMAWPTPEQEKIPAQVADAVVRWSAYPEAAHYRVEISEVTRSASSARYVPVASKTVTHATELPLAALSTLPGDTASREYSVEVTALAEDGSFLSVSEHAFQGGSFTLTDGHRFLPKRMQSQLESGTTAEDIEKMLANDKRLDAVAVLIEEGMLDAAEPLLAKIDMASAGRKEAVTGFLRASQGRCEEATMLLKQANAQGGSLCVPAAYWAGCR